MVARIGGEWTSTTEVSGDRFSCGYCGADTGPSRRYHTGSYGEHRQAYIWICPSCNRPTFILGDKLEQMPGPMVGRTITGITDAEVEKLYGEARKALANGAPSAAVLVCRKLLMHIAVEQGAKENKGFAYYAEYLEDEHIVGAPFAGVVDHIKEEGNKENHELEVSSIDEATMLLKLVEFLLASIYELPGMIPSEVESPAPAEVEATGPIEHR